MKEKRIYLALAILGLVLAIYLYPLSFIPQSDISFAIGRVSVQGDKGVVWGAYPGSVSWSRSRDHKNLMPGVAVTTTLSGVKEDRNYTMTFNNTRYALYAYIVYLEVEVKAIGGEPTGPKIDQGVTVSVWLSLKSRGDWRLLWVKSENITETSRWTSPRIPKSNWNVEGGSANAMEPAAINGLVSVTSDMTAPSGAINYYYDYEQYWEAGAVDGKKLYLKCYLRAPEAWFWDLWSLNYYYAWGESIVIWRLALSVVIAEELLPEQPNLGSLIDNAPKVQGLKNVPSIPWWIWIVALVIVAFIIWNVTRVIVAIKAGGKSVVV